MPLKISSDTQKIISIEEYVDFIHTNVIIDDLDNLQETSPALKALSNDPKLIINVINEQMKSGNRGRKMYTPQSLALAVEEHWMVRANIWTVPSQDPRLAAFETPLFSYLTAHNHNFHFLTVGHFGDGYETELYECNPEKILGYPGEAVDLKYIGREQLAKDDMMLYRAGIDVHAQHPPKDLSISLNLMVAPPEVVKQQQYFFDLDEKRIANSFPDDSVHLRQSLLAFSRHINDENTFDILRTISGQHSCYKTRAEALYSMLTIKPEERDYVMSLAKKDKYGDMPVFIERIAAAYPRSDFLRLQAAR